MTVIITITGIICWLAIAGFIVSRLWRHLRSRGRLDVSGRAVVVTGCDSGIGLGVVEQLVAKGASVVAFTYTADGAARALQAGAKAAMDFDITDWEALEAAAVQALEFSGGKLWGLVHNAGVVLPGFIEYQSLANYQRVMDVNFFAVTALTQLLIPALKAGCGRVVLVSSVDGIVSLPGNAPYDAAKFAIEGYADALRAELSYWQIDVAVINPSTMRTPLAMNFFEGHFPTWNAMDRQDPNGPWKEAWPQEWLEEYVARNSDQLERIVQDPRHAIDDILHALTAKHPHHRYLSGAMAKTVFYALWKMPEVWSIAIKKRLIYPPPPISTK